MTKNHPARRLRLAAVGLLLLLTITGLAPRAFALATATGASPNPPPVAPGMARLWLYRDYQPYQSLATPYVRANGAIIGVSQPGAAFYRDLPAGIYTISVDCEGTDVNQFATVPMAAGQHVFVKILSLNSWATGGGGNFGTGWARDTFYTWWVLPQAATPEIARMPLYGG